MKDSKFKINKDIKKYILKLFVVTLISNFIALSLTNFLYYYNRDNKGNIIEPEVISAKTSDLYTTPASYATLLSKLNTIDGYFPDYTTTGGVQTNPYSLNGMNLGKNSNSTHKSWLDFYYNNKITGTMYSNSSTNGLVIAANNSSGTEGQGTLNLIGNPVKINNVDTAFLANTGYIKPQTPTAVSVSKGASNYKNIATISLAAGTWIVSCAGQFASNSSGMRSIRFGTGSNDSSVSSYAYMSMPAASGTTTTLNVTAVVTPTATTNYYLKATHTSTASTLNVTGTIHAIRIK